MITHYVLHDDRIVAIGESYEDADADFCRRYLAAGESRDDQTFPVVTRNEYLDKVWEYLDKVWDDQHHANR